MKNPSPELANYLRGLDHSLQLHEAAANCQEEKPELVDKVEDMIVEYSPDTTIAEFLPMARLETAQPVTLKKIWHGIKNLW
jgi:hypothetical protein